RHGSFLPILRVFQSPGAGAVRATAPRSTAGRPGPDAQPPDARFGEVEARERAQEGVRDDDVDARLRRVVEPAADPHGDRRVEVANRDLDANAPTAVVGVLQARDLDLKVPSGRQPAAGDEHAAGDLPAYDAALGADLVLGRMERE